MNKIGILTFHITENYGAMLQAFALLTVINKNGGDAVIINYPLKSKEMSISKIISHNIWMIVRFFFGNKIRQKKAIQFRENFLNLKGVPLVRDIFNDKNVKTLEKYVVGSDQVWNLSITEDPAYRLDFVDKNKKKYSYAASIGSVSFNDNQKKIFKKSLSSFNAISLRESSSIPMLKELNIDCVSVLDPTLLLSKEDWIEELSLSCSLKNKYLFCYVLPGNKTNKFTIDLAKKIAKEKGWDVVILGEREYMRLFSNIYCTTAGPKEFVEYVYNAEFVVTNSFHGTCFSINFEKNFYSIISSNSKRSNRTKDLLSSLGLEHRCISDVNEPLKNINDVSFDCSYQKLMKLRKLSMDFIKRIVVD